MSTAVKNVNRPSRSMRRKLARFNSSKLRFKASNAPSENPPKVQRATRRRVVKVNGHKQEESNDL